MFTYQIDDDISLVQMMPYMADDLYALIEKNRAHLEPWFPWAERTKSVDDITNFLQSCLEKQAKNEGFEAIITYQGKMAGVIGCHNWSHKRKIAEIGYWLDQDMQGKGIMHAAATAMINAFFNEYGMNRIVIRARSQNAPSCNVAKKLGFTHESTEQDGDCDQNGVFYDYEIYRLLAREWKS